MSAQKLLKLTLYKSFIDSNDAKSLDAAIKADKPTKSLLQETFYYAALMGDCQGMRTLLMNGAKADSKSIHQASDTSKLIGQGGHTMAALYIKAVMDGSVQPKTLLSKLKIVEM